MGLRRLAAVPALLIASGLLAGCGGSGLGDEVAGLKPPKDADSANSELARGEHDTAAEVRAVLPKLSTYTSPKAAVGFLNSQIGQAKGGPEIDHALAQLRKLSYTKGS